MTDDEIVERFDRDMRAVHKKALAAAAMVASLMGRPDIGEQIMGLVIPDKAAK